MQQEEQIGRNIYLLDFKKESFFQIYGQRKNKKIGADNGLLKL